MSDRKCFFCGSTDLVYLPLFRISGLDTEIHDNVDSMVCVECGRIDLMAKPEQIKAILDSREKKQKKDAKLSEIQKRISELNKEIKDLKAIVDDENQTVKAVKEAMRRIPELEQELEAQRKELQKIL